MANTLLIGIVLMLSAGSLVTIPEACLAQPELYEQEMILDELTADQQDESTQDHELTEKIRHAVANDKALSSYARKVRIIVVDGMVTLKGTVKSEKEKKAIEEKAATIAGNGNIKSEMNIAPH